MTYPYDPMFQATMPNDYGSPTNFGAYGGNPNAQGWGLNSSYLTPSYLAPYRPQYSGNPNFQMPNMNFAQAARNISPFASDTPYYADPQMMRAQAGREFASKVGDAGMSAAQIMGSTAVGLAVMASVDSFRFQGLGGSQADVRGVAHGFRSMMPTWLGGAATSTEAAYLARSQTLMEAGGRYAGHAAGWLAGKGVSGTLQAGSMLLRGRGISNLPNIAGAVARAGAIAGATAGSLLAPFALMEAAVATTDRLVFSPYVSGRQNADMIQDSLRGTYTGYGSNASPLSMTNLEASKRGFEMSRSMVEGNTFGMRAGADIYSNAYAMGLFKGTGFGQHEMKKRMKDVTESVSLIMSVFNDPSTQEAITRLSQLAHGGGLKSYTDISQLSQKYRVASAVTGIGSRELMSGVGQQGQMMYAQSGLMPYLGQYAALNAMSGLTAGYRAGLISTPSLAMMGGVEGATQMSMQAQLGLASTPYFGMTAYNKAMGYNGSSITGNMATFGQSMANNPIRAYGGYLLNKDVFSSHALKNDPASVMDQIFEQAKYRPGSFNREGKLYVEAATAIAAEQGIDPTLMRALFGEIQGSAVADRSGARAAAFEQSRAAMFNTNGAYYMSDGTFGAYSPGRILYSAMRIGKDTLSYMSKNIMEPISNMASSAGDWFTNTNYKMSAIYGGDAGLSANEGLTAEDWSGTTNIKSRKYDVSAYNKRTGRSKQTASSLAKSGVLMASGLAIGGLVATTVGLPVTLGGLGLATLGYGTAGVTTLAGIGQLVGIDRQDAEVMAGPDARTQSLINTLGSKATRDPSLLDKVRNPTPENLAVISSALGGIGIDKAREVADWYASSSEGSTNVSLMGDYMSSAAISMQRGLDGSMAAESRAPTIKANLGSLTEDERLTLMAFATKNRSALGDVETFLMATAGNPVMKGILSKMGYSGMFGSGPGAMATAKEALIGINAASSAGRESNLKQAVVETAAAMAAGKGSMNKLVRMKDVQKYMSKANDAVSRTGKTSIDAFSAGVLAADSPLSVTSAVIAQQSSIDSSLRSLGNAESRIDFTGLVNASTKLDDAGTNLLEAAKILRGGGTGSGRDAWGEIKNLTSRVFSSDPVQPEPTQ